MKKVAIFIPTYHRLHAIERMAINLRKNTPVDQYEIWFITERDDMDSYKEARDFGRVIINQREPSYAGAINDAYLNTTEPYFFTGADDLDFHKGWLELALSHMGNSIRVVGTNDLGTTPIEGNREATHCLIDRKYISEQSGVIDMPNTVLYPYEHNYTDRELIETAKMRGVYAYCPESIVEHLHWAWGKAKMDETYRKGLESNSRDEAIYHSRVHLWTK